MTESAPTAPDTGRVALVTGASRGIGLAVARGLVARGDRVCLTGRTAETLHAAVEDLGADRATAVAGKAHDPQHQADAVAHTMERWGRIDHLVNNAGTNPVVGPLAELDLAAARKLFEVNVLAALGFAQRVWAASQREHGGTVVNMSSLAGVSASPFVAAYGMSKAALINLTEQLAHEFAPAVRVNALAPAVVRTRFARALYEGREAEVAARYPLGRLGTPEDVAGAVAFLTSDDAGWMTGQTVVLDGGLLLNAGVA